MPQNLYINTFKILGKVPKWGWKAYVIHKGLSIYGKSLLTHVHRQQESPLKKTSFFSVKNTIQHLTIFFLLFVLYL